MSEYPLYNKIRQVDLYLDNLTSQPARYSLFHVLMCPRCKKKKNQRGTYET